MMAFQVNLQLLNLSCLMLMSLRLVPCPRRMIQDMPPLLDLVGQDHLSHHHLIQLVSIILNIVYLSHF